VAELLQTAHGLLSTTQEKLKFTYGLLHLPLFIVKSVQLLFFSDAFYTFYTLITLG
jgi:hypothetical protein